MNSVPFIPQCDPYASYAAQETEIKAAIHHVLEQGRYILGPEVAAFESEFAAYIGTAHAVGVGNGTDALELALRALGIGEGDAVITVSHSAVATAVAIRSTGAIPIFADVDPEYGLMDPGHVDQLMGQASKGLLCVPKDRIRAIVPVHLYGRCADMDAIQSLAGKNDLTIVEDCAQAHGAMFAKRRAGTFGALASFSFYPTKNLGAIGDGGAVVTSDPELHARLRLLRQYGWRQRYISDIEGGNSRLDELQAAILRVKLARLDVDNAARCAIADIYRSTINNTSITISAPSQNLQHVFHQFVVRCAEREKLKQFLEGRGIGTLVHYPVPIHLQPAYSDPAFTPLKLKETEKWAQEVLSLPMFPQLTVDSARRVATALSDWRPGVA